MRRVALAVLAACAGCAGAGETLTPPPSPFRAVRSLVLVRAVEDRGQRPKDPLDGLDETLRARGFTTRVVELGPKRPPELAGLERLFGQLEVRAATGRRERIATPVSSAGRDAAAAVAQLGVDAVASYHRLDRRRTPALPPSTAPGTLFPPSAPPTLDRPLGALVLVDREGHVAVFAWGDGGALEEPSVPLNAAEAIDQLVQALTGELPEE
jgi:hypothetical protein